jgi:DNA replication protein DnaC
MAELITQRIQRNAAELRLHAIAANPDELIERAEHAQLGYREFLDLLLESEVGVLEGRRYQARLKMAGLPHHKTLDDFDISFQPDLDAKRLAELRSLRFIERKVGALVLGPPGVGKSHISVGLGMEALARGYLVRYSTLDDLVRGLRHADALGKLPSKLAQLQRPHLLILDLCRDRDYAEPVTCRKFEMPANRRVLDARAGPGIGIVSAPDESTSS